MLSTDRKESKIDNYDRRVSRVEKFFNEVKEFKVPKGKHFTITDKNKFVKSHL